MSWLGADLRERRPLRLLTRDTAGLPASRPRASGSREARALRRRRHGQAGIGRRSKNLRRRRNLCWRRTATFPPGLLLRQRLRPAIRRDRSGRGRSGRGRPHPLAKPGLEPSAASHQNSSEVRLGVGPAAKGAATGRRGVHMQAAPRASRRFPQARGPGAHARLCGLPDAPSGRRATPLTPHFFRRSAVAPASLASWRSSAGFAHNHQRRVSTSDTGTKIHPKRITPPRAEALMKSHRLSQTRPLMDGRTTAASHQRPATPDAASTAVIWRRGANLRQQRTRGAC